MVRKISTDDSAQSLDVKKSVLRFQRVKSPLNAIQPAPNRVFTLRKLQGLPQTPALVLGQYSQRKRVIVAPPPVPGRHGGHEANHLTLGRESAQHITADFRKIDKQPKRVNLLVGISPDFLLQADAGREFLESVAGL